MPILVGEYYYVNIEESIEPFQIPKTPFHRQKLMPDHRICEKLASKLESANNRIQIKLNNIPNANLFQKILNFSFTSSSEITVSRSEYNDLDIICNFFNLENFRMFSKEEFLRMDFLNLGMKSIFGNNGDGSGCLCEQISTY